MAQPAKLWSNRQGFLLLEATLTVAVIAIGLTLITRGVAGSLHALSSLQAYDHLMRAAASTLNELEARAQAGASIEREGLVGVSPNVSRWTLSVQPVPPDTGLGGATAEAMRVVTITVTPSNRESPAVHLTTLWPMDWVGP